MGKINHNAIIATTSDSESFEEMLRWMKTSSEDNYCVSNQKVNGYKTIVYFPDGSKEGWGESDKHDHIRDMIIEKLESFNNEDWGSLWDYVEVGFGEYGQKVLRGNNENMYNDNEYAI